MPTPETIALLADLNPARVTVELLHRLATLGLDRLRDAPGDDAVRKALRDQIVRQERAHRALAERS